ncbi:hypothetical protein POM88_020188 [Heracleum sosnowskyi]|uniref:AIG1-type G domain-containing protein n=1 Tax=Heracleum sosnowskyi TaxID=360622 RepID=A0AAD8IDM1_9APIA|nr:hypothetical protein POM88_020188 [Heracleum sosnowskyi]
MMIARRRLLSSPTIWARLFPSFREPHHSFSSVSHTSNVIIHTQNQETSKTDIKTIPTTTSNSHISQHHLEKPISKIPTLSQTLTDPTRIADALLNYRNDPDSALKYFKLVEMTCKSVNRNDPFCVLIYILASSEAHNHVLGRKINGLVCRRRGFVGPGFVDQLVGVAKRFDFELNYVVFSELLVSFVNACRFGDAVKCFNRMVENDIAYSIRDVNLLLSRLVDNERFSVARGLYDGLVGRGTYDCEMLGHVVRACENEMKFRDAGKYLKEAVYNGLKPDMEFYTRVIFLVCKGSDVNCAYELCNKMKEVGLAPSKKIYMHLLGAYVNHRDMVGALKVKDDMVANGVPLKLGVAERLMKGCILTGDLDSALGLLEAIVRDGLAPKGRTYSILIRGCCELGNMKKAKELYNRMKLLGMKPTVVDVNTLIRGFLKANLWEDAVKVFRVESDVINVLSYSLLISWLCKEGQMNKACNLREEMLIKGFAPSEVACRNMVRGLCKVGRISEAWDTLKKLVKDGFASNRKMYNNVLIGLLKGNTFDSAFAVYTEMRESGFYPEISTCKTLLDGLIECNSVNLAIKLMNDMRNNSLKLDVNLYGVLIDGFCKCNDMGSARELFDELLRVGLSPNTVVYNRMVKGFIHVDNLDAAVTFHKRMIDDGIPCDLETYTILLDGLLKEGKLLPASNLYTEMLGNGIKPDEKTHTVLVNSLCSKKQLDNARQVLQEMKSTSIVPTVLIYYTLIAGYFREGNMQEAFDLHDEMLDSGLSPYDTTYDILVQGKVRGNVSLADGYVPLDQVDAKEEGTMISKFSSSFFNSSYGFSFFQATLVKFLSASAMVYLQMIEFEYLQGCEDFYPVIRNMFNRIVSGFSGDVGSNVVDQLVDCAKRFDFELNYVVFDYLLNGFVRAGRFVDAIGCFRRIVECKISLPLSCINFLVSRLVKNNLIEEAEDLYKGLVVRGTYDCATVDVIVRACMKEGKYDEVGKYFREAKGSGVKVDVSVYCSVIHAVCKIPDADYAYELLKEMKGMGWVPAEGTRTCVVGAYVNQKNMVGALKVRDEMVADGIPINLVVATSLMKGYCLEGNLGKALGLFEEIERDGPAPNKVTYSVLIEGCCRHGNMQKAKELYSRMKLIGIEPTVYHVNSLIRGFLEAKSWEEALVQFHDAVECGVFNGFTYNVLMSSLCKAGKMSEACNLWDDMLSKGLVPSVVSYNNLILGYCRQGNMDSASNMFADMLGKGLKPDVITYSILIDGHFKKREVEEAFKYFDQMLSLGLAPTNFTYNKLVNGLCIVRRTSEARDRLKKLLGNGFIPDCMTYNSIINGFVKENAINSALDVYTEMCESGFSPNVITYTTLVDGLLKSNNYDLAIKLKNEMKNRGLKLDVTAYGVFIDGYCKRGDMESARELFDELYVVGLFPNTVVYNSMISGFKSLNDMDTALSLHNQMIEDGIPCDLATYTTLIDGLLKVGKVLEATDLYTQMLADGIKPDVIVYSVLISGLCNKGQVENARKVVQEMESKNTVPNVLIYNSIIAGYFREGNLVEGFKLHDEMLEKGVTPDDTTYDILVSRKTSGSSSQISAKFFNQTLQCLGDEMYSVLGLHELWVKALLVKLYLDYRMDKFIGRPGTIMREGKGIWRSSDGEKSYDKQPKLSVEKEGISGESSGPDLSKFQPERIRYSTIKSCLKKEIPQWLTDIRKSTPTLFNLSDEDPNFDVDKFLADRLTQRSSVLKSAGQVRPLVIEESELKCQDVLLNNIDEQKRKLKQLESMGVTFFRLVRRLGMSDESSVVAKVLRGLMIVAERQIGHPFVPDTAKNTALQLEKDGKENLDCSLNILMLGKSGVGKTTTINAIFGEKKAQVDTFQPGTTTVTEIIGVIDGVKVRVFDTPGLKTTVLEQSFNRNILKSVKKLTRKYPVDIVLYVDRLDAQTQGRNDRPLLHTITNSLGFSIWHRTIVTLTHAASVPLEGPFDSSSSFDMIVTQQSRVLKEHIGQAAGYQSMMGRLLYLPVCPVENHWLCPRDSHGEKVLPNGKSWRAQLMILCHSMKLLSDAISFSKPQDSVNPRTIFGFLTRVRFLPCMLSSVLRSLVLPKFATEQGSDIGQWRGDLSLGFCTLPQLSIGRNSKVAVGAGTTKKLSGQISIRTSSSEHFFFALASVLAAASSMAGRFVDAIDCFRRIVECKISLPVSCINFLVSRLVKNNLIEEAKDLYKGLVVRGTYDCATVDVILRALVSELEEGVQGLTAFPPVLGLSLGGGGTDAGGKAACVVRDEMVADGIPINLVVATSLMKGYCLEGNLGKALGLFEEIERDGPAPNKVTYSVLIEGCCRHGNMQKAKELYSRMKLIGIEPTVYHVNSLIRGFLEAKSWEEALVQFHDAVECGVFNGFTYNVLMSSLCKAGKMSEACNLWDDMLSKGLVPSVVSYNNLILGYCRQGNMDSASNMFADMLGKGLKPDVITYSILIDGHFKKREVEEAFKYFDQMLSLGLAPTNFTYNKLVNGLCIVRRTSEARDRLKKLLGNGFIPDCMTYNSIINGFVKENAINSALDVYTEMCESGFSPNVITYTTLVDGLLKSNNYDLAIKLKNEMKKRGLKLDVTAYGVFIDGYCKRGDMESARELFDELYVVGLFPNTVVYNSMISGFKSLNDMDTALSLHNQMIEDGIPCDLATYTTLIDGLLKVGKVLEATDLYTQMLADGIKPDVIVYSVLISGLCNKGQVENARKVVQEMESKNTVPNVLIYNSIIAGYFREGNLVEGFKLHDEMLEKGVTPDDTTYDILVSRKTSGSSSQISAKFFNQTLQCLGDEMYSVLGLHELWVKALLVKLYLDYRMDKFIGRPGTIMREGKGIWRSNDGWKLIVKFKTKIV